MPIGEQENSFVSFVSNAGKQSPRFIEREKLDRLTTMCARGSTT
jgi:hypothetical protein